MSMTRMTPSDLERDISDSGLVSFNPTTRVLTDFRFVYNQTWYQYQRYIAADNSSSFIYFAIGNTLSQVILFDITARKAHHF